MNKSKEARKVRIVLINPAVLGHMFQTGEAFRVEEGLPSGAKYSGTQLDEETQNIALIFEHESFEKVARNANIPALTLKFSRVEDV